jgi:hypothetical protein
MLRTGPIEPFISQLRRQATRGRIEMDEQGSRDPRTAEATRGASPVDELESHWAASIDSATD